MSNPHKPCRGPHRDAFTLVELLVVVGIIALLIGILVPTLSRAREQSVSAKCLSNLRQIGLAVTLYCNDNKGYFPRSTHSAGSASVGPGRVLRWSYALMPYLNAGPPATGTSDPRYARYLALLNRFLRCPSDIRDDDSHSYGKSVWIELRGTEPGMNGITYWRNTDVRKSSSVVLFGELKTSTAMSDHMMAHFWVVASAPPEVDPKRHGSTSNYLFADGHAAALEFESTFDLSRQRDNWNPQTAR